MGLSLFGTVGGGLTIYGVEPLLDAKARDYKILEGRFLSPDRGAYDIVMVRSYAEEKAKRSPAIERPMLSAWTSTSSSSLGESAPT